MHTCTLSSHTKWWLQPEWGSQLIYTAQYTKMVDNILQSYCYGIELNNVPNTQTYTKSCSHTRDSEIERHALVRAVLNESVAASQATLTADFCDCPHGGCMARL